MIRRIPIVPTLLVLAAVGLMIRLGVWQLDRLHQKEEMLARYEAAQADRSVHPWPNGSGAAPAGYTRLSLVCDKVIAQEATAGRSAADQPGWAHAALCEARGGGRARVVLGWSERPDSVVWAGGPVTGVYVPQADFKLRVVADPPLAGLAANARPDPRDIPNNHLSYAIQWFLFAATALVIYCIALAKRWRER